MHKATNSTISGSLKTTNHSLTEDDINRLLREKIRQEMGKRKQNKKQKPSLREEKNSLFQFQ